MVSVDVKHQVYLCQSSRREQSDLSDMQYSSGCLKSTKRKWHGQGAIGKISAVSEGTVRGLSDAQYSSGCLKRTNIVWHGKGTKGYVSTISEGTVRLVRGNYQICQTSGTRLAALKARRETGMAKEPKVMSPLSLKEQSDLSDTVRVGLPCLTQTALAWQGTVQIMSPVSSKEQSDLSDT